MSRVRLAATALAAVLYVFGPRRWSTTVRARDDSLASQVAAATRELDARISDAEQVVASPARWTRLRAVSSLALPASVDIHGMLDELRATAQANGVQLISITSSPPQSDGTQPVATTLSLRIDGSTPAIEGFLTGLRASTRLITVPASTYTRDQGATTMSALLTVSVWSMP